MRLIVAIFFLFIVNIPASAGVLTRWDSPIMTAVADSYLAGNLNLSKEQKQEVECLSKVIFFEARGEKPLGKVMVANVVANRTKYGRPFANTTCSVVYQRKQFSWTSEKWKKQASFNQIAAKFSKNESKSVEDSLKIALFFTIFRPENTGKATHFSSGNDKFPGTKFIRRVGEHRFYEYYH